MAISAEVSLATPSFRNSQADSHDTEYYRFLYNVEPISLREVLEDGVATPKVPYAAMLIATIIVGVLAFACLGYVFLKKLVPLIGRLRKSNYLINEEIKQDSRPTIDENFESNKGLEADAQV